MDKKIVSAIFILLCIVIPLLWFTISYTHAVSIGTKAAQNGHNRLTMLAQTVLASSNPSAQQFQFDLIIKQEPQICGFAVYKNNEPPVVLYPSTSTIAALTNESQKFNIIRNSTDLSGGYSVLSFSELVPLETIRKQGFQALGLFLILFFIFLIGIALFPARKGQKLPDTDAIQESDLHAESSASEENSSLCSEPDLETQKIQEEQPQKQIRTTLFDPVTGLCWAEDLIPRLDEEIKRAASFENELVFIIASLDMKLYEPEDYTTFCETVQKFFSFRDMIFQYKDDSIGIILQNMDIEHALRMCDELIKKITYLIQQNKNEMHYVEAFFGMSSRGGRILDSKRLIHEAEAALLKAKEEHDTHVVAFKPDLERYKQYILSSKLEA